MKYNTIRLENGLRIIHLPSSSLVVYCGYGINAGTANEEAGEEGIAHFCEHATFKGTQQRSSLDIINCLESVGGDLNAYTTKTATVYHSAILKEHFPLAADLLSDIVFRSIYPQKEIDKEVEVICDEIESYNDSPAELIYDEFENLLFRNHPLGHSILGTAERVRSFKSEDARRFTDRFYRPENSVFFIYGDVDFSETVDLLKRYTANVQRTSPFTPLEDATAAVEAEHLYHPANITIRKKTHQAHVMIGNRAYNVHDKKRIVLYLLNNVLGGPGMSARLNLSLREEHGLVYTVESFMTAYSTTGMWGIYFGCDPKDVKQCTKLVRQELDRFMNVPLSDEKLKLAKQQIKGQIGIAEDNRENFALGFCRSFLHFGWEKHTEKLYEQIDAITAEQIQQVAREIFREEELTTLVYK
ncbi:pitrilysin family protein [Prevotella sp. HUN102]|uniref:M16 family metallopeptidase n=1 Tax=Prevotella sp. HUN102 TaxID=1392486 RepID=UPI00048AD58A|nr:pitrilysin family protein [Prevotella sp. HUN102]